MLKNKVSGKNSGFYKNFLHRLNSQLYKLLTYKRLILRLFYERQFQFFTRIAQIDINYVQDF